MISWRPSTSLVNCHKGRAFLCRSSLFDTQMRPKIVAKPTEFNKKVLQRCRMFYEDYTKPFFIFNNHVETILVSRYRKDLGLEYDREFVNTPDSGLVSLDTLKGAKPMSDQTPVVILLAGLAGGSYCRYVQYAVKSLEEAGMRAVVFNSRGCASTPVKTPKFYSASFTEDLRLIVNILRQRHPSSQICAIGWSLGANILVNYLGEEKGDTPLAAAVSLCNPFDLTKSDANLKGGFNVVYDYYLSQSMKEVFKDHLSLFRGYDTEKAMSSTTVRGLDETITAVSFGWESVDAYYQGSGSARNIPKVEIPLLCIQAKDDPIAISDSIPIEAIESNCNCQLVVTPYGGHLGWVTPEEGLFGPPWTNKASIEWLSAVLECLTSSIQNLDRQSRKQKAELSL